MHSAALIGGPYFVIYLLQDLHLAHWQYGSWLAAGIIGQFMTLPAWGLQIGAWTLEPASNLLFIFFLSSLLRLFVSATLLKTFHEPREVEHRANHRLLWELPLLKPLRQFSRRAVTTNQ